LHFPITTKYPQLRSLGFSCFSEIQKRFVLYICTYVCENLS
jgi:hypothetical protein